MLTQSVGVTSPSSSLLEEAFDRERSVARSWSKSCVSCKRPRILILESTRYRFEGSSASKMRKSCCCSSTMANMGCRRRRRWCKGTSSPTTNRPWRKLRKRPLRDGVVWPERGPTEACFSSQAPNFAALQGPGLLPLAPECSSHSLNDLACHNSLS